MLTFSALCVPSVIALFTFLYPPAPVYISVRNDKICRIQSITSNLRRWINTFFVIT